MDRPSSSVHGTTSSEPASNAAKPSDEPAPPNEPSALVGTRPVLEQAAFVEGHARGQAASLQLPADAPFTPTQRAWLSGFLSGLFEPGATAYAAMPHPAAAESLGGFAASATSFGDKGTAPRLDPSFPLPTAAAASVQLSPSAQYSNHNPYAARILELTPAEEVPNAWHVVLDVEGSSLQFRAGDLLGVLPANEPDLVRRVLRQLGARGQEPITTSHGTNPVWKVLLEELDLQSVTPELVWLLSSCARNSEETLQLEVLARASQPPEGNVFAFMRRFPSAKPLLTEFAAALGPLIPRIFPVSVSGSRHSSTVEALLSGQQGTLMSDLRDGKLKAGDWLPIFVYSRPEAHPPRPDETPVVLVAVGDGVAAAHAFIAERSGTRTRGRNWVFLESDAITGAFAYARQFSAWQTSRAITRLDVAPGAQLLERFKGQFDMVQRWLTDRSTLYVFGDAKTCRAYYETLVVLLSDRLRVSAEDAQQRVETLRTSGQLRLISY